LGEHASLSGPHRAKSRRSFEGNRRLASIRDMKIAEYGHLRNRTGKRLRIHRHPRFLSSLLQPMFGYDRTWNTKSREVIIRFSSDVVVYAYDGI
jgi:hypothetical protein